MKLPGIPIVGQVFLRLHFGLLAGFSWGELAREASPPPAQVGAPSLQFTRYSYCCPSILIAAQVFLWLPFGLSADFSFWCVWAELAREASPPCPGRLP